MSIASLVKELRERTGAGMMDCKKALEACDQNMDQAIDWLRENGIAKVAKKGDRVAAEGLTNIIVSGNEAVIFELNSETDFVAKNDQFLTLLNTVATTLLASKASTLEEALAYEVDGVNLETVVNTGAAKIGEKITLRRFSFKTKTDDQTFANYSHMGGKISVLMVLDGNNEEVAKNVCMHIAAVNPRYISSKDVDADVLAKEEEILTKEALNEGKPANIVENMVKGRIKKFLKDICLLDQQFVMDSDKSVNDVLTSGSLSVLDFTRFEVGEGIEKEEVDFAAEVAAQVNA